MTGKILYGFLFIVLLPFLLVTWANHTENVVYLSIGDWTAAGYILSVVGFLMMGLGMLNLWKHGQGLPMNAFPPKLFVTKGIYKFFSHPIYIGASLICVGISLITQSASGLWIISPIFILLCFTLVLGYENNDLKQRFGNIQYRSLINLSENKDEKTTKWDIISIYILTLIPWIILYEAVVYMGIPLNAVDTHLPFEKYIPVIESTEILYGLTFPYILILPIFIRSKKQMRDCMISAWCVTAIGIFFLICLPFIASQKEFMPKTLLGDLLILERSLDCECAAFPSFHVIFVFLASKFYIDIFPKLKSLWIFLAIGISISCITTSMHSILDVIAGYLVFLTINERKSIWKKLQQVSEKIANSWKEWYRGRIRIINHGFYAGLACFVGFVIVAIFIENIYAIATVTISSLLFSGLLGQFVEGSPRLSRPFGYFGGIAGGIIGCVAVHYIFHIHFFEITAAFAIASPWIQSIGRLRCLVQGCCHGKTTTSDIGIKYTHEKSRVNQISNLRNQYLHNTQLYSILSNIVTGIILIKLWSINTPLPFIGGMYLILSGMSRFVEESYRGETQTLVIAKLRIYQWMSVFNIIVGAVLTTFHSSLSLQLNNAFAPMILIIALLLGLLSAFAMGIDFPRSNIRFSRLSGS
ncbi:MAG: prolipoprotein diacylglyceryl transferase family protein [Bacteroidota bacterium]